ncbi:MAG: ERF family protein [Cetobacterium sp.]
MENKKNETKVENKNELKENANTHIIEKERIIEKQVPVETVKEVIKEVEKEVIKELHGKVNFENVSEIFKSLVKFNAEMENISKSAENPFFGSSYLDLSAISNTVRPLLAKHGVSILQYPVQDSNDRIAVNTVLTHENGETLEFPGIFIKPSKIGDIQSLGSTITYLRRYEIGAILFVAGKDEDDDGESAMNRTEATTQTKQANTTPPTSGRIIRR